MDKKESYMLQRDEEESRRLNAQSKFLRALFHGHLVHPSIPRHELRAVADVGTGTGVWLEEVRQELDATSGGQTVQLTGFDVSGDQFPRQTRPGVEFRVHDAVQPFPIEYHDRFDLVHLRFLSYGIQADRLESFVDSVLQILRPGGYLEWQEIDGIDAWTIPETSRAKQMISWLVSERIARGLTPAITAPLVKTLLSRSTSAEPGVINPMCWTEDLLRIYHLETLSTYKHPSPEVKSRKNQWTFNVLVQLLQSGAARRLALAEEPPVPPSDASRLVVEVAEINQLVEAIKNGEDPATGEIEVAVTWIVARKAMLYGKEGPWMSAWHRP